MSVQTRQFADPISLARAFANDFADWLKTVPSGPVSVALSGGSTPKILFELWASQADTVDWSRIHFYWGDERCVPPEDPESNYGVAKKLLFDKISIPAGNIHRILGEADPEQERARYEEEVRAGVTAGANGQPRFDLVILGMGEDGHTASIFPHQSEFLTSPRVCEVATHPESGQRRITLTGSVINQAALVAFLITGGGKAAVLRDVIHRSGDFADYPASSIEADDVKFYVDDAAAQKL